MIQNAGRARPPNVRPATSHPKVWVKNHNGEFKLEGIDHRKYCGFGGWTASSTLSGSFFPSHTTSGLGYWSSWPAPIHALTGHIVQLRIRKVPWKGVGASFGAMSEPAELGPVSNPAHECSFQKRIEKGGTVPDDYLLRRTNFQLTD